MTPKLFSKMKLFFCGSIVTVCGVICAILITTIFKTVSTNEQPSTLEFVIGICRHGSRSPLFYYPTDPYKPDYWKDGKGKLTIKGKQQMYKVGQNLKHRYESLFQGKYKQEDIYVKTTQFARTYMSVALLLAGMFPPKDEQIWNSNINWQPIPIWPDYMDKNEIVTNHSACLKFTEEQQQLISASQDYLNSHQDLLDYIEKHSAIKIKRLPDFMNVWDPLSCEDANELPLPAWTKSIYPEKMKPFAAYMFNTMVSGNKIMNRLLIGPVLKDFHSWIDRKMNNAVTEKMLLHSGHDFTIIGLLSAVGFTDIDPIEPSASIMIEFYRSSLGREVKMFYANSSKTEEPLQMTMPKCKDPCLLEEFLKMINELEPDDWEKECNMK